MQDPSRSRHHGIGEDHPTLSSLHELWSHFSSVKSVESPDFASRHHRTSRLSRSAQLRARVRILTAFPNGMAEIRIRNYAACQITCDTDNSASDTLFVTLIGLSVMLCLTDLLGVGDRLSDPCDFSRPPTLSGVVSAAADGQSANPPFYL